MLIHFGISGYISPTYSINNESSINKTRFSYNISLIKCLPYNFQLELPSLDFNTYQYKKDNINYTEDNVRVSIGIIKNMTIHESNLNIFIGTKSSYCFDAKNSNYNKYIQTAELGFNIINIANNTISYVINYDVYCNNKDYKIIKPSIQYKILF